MRDESQIIINRVIVHGVDHHKNDSAQHSDLETPIPEEVANFLKHHIISGHEHKYTNIARFLNGNKSPSDPRPLKEEIDDLLGATNSEQFVEESKIIATRLFDAVKNDKKISPSELVICTFCENLSDYMQLALLKMDPADGFVGKREKIKNKVRFIMEKIPEMLPTGGLQKCAFILPKTLREAEDYDLKVLDMQMKRYGIQRPAASFFTETFLQCQVPPPSVDQGIIVLDNSRGWIEQKKEEWPEEDVENFHERLKEQLKKETVDIDAFSQTAIKDPVEQEQYIAALRASGLRSLTFTNSPQVKSQIAEYIWFEGANGLKVRIKPGDVEDPDVVGNKKMLEQVYDQVTGNWIITIRTPFWEKKIR